MVWYDSRISSERVLVRKLKLGHYPPVMCFAPAHEQTSQNWYHWIISIPLCLGMDNIFLSYTLYMVIFLWGVAIDPTCINIGGLERTEPNLILFI